MLYFLCVRYWDTRQHNPVHTQQLPDRCYAMSVRYPLMVVGTADRNLIVFNLKNPQVIFYSKINFHNVLFVAF
jgi:mRNA export factor